MELDRDNKRVFSGVFGVEVLGWRDIVAYIGRGGSECIMAELMVGGERLVSGVYGAVLLCSCGS